jgi:Predicted metal-dependent hydrolase of the TIM-barrel fold
MLNEVDRCFYSKELFEFLPDKLFDCHAHMWLKDHRTEKDFPMRSAMWVSDLTAENSGEELMQDIKELLPGKEVEGLFFGYVDPDIDIKANNRYVCNMAKKFGFNGLAVSRPDWTKEEMRNYVKENGLLGLKPYINFVSPGIKTEDITIFDMVSPEQFKAANEDGYIILMHLPRPGRLADKTNIEQLLTIENKYPNVSLIVAHIGRAYTVENLGDSLKLLKYTKNMCFDFSGNTNSEVIKRALDTFGCKRVLYGSDLPLTHMRMKRIYENGKYINLVEKGLYPGLENDKSIKEVSKEEAKDFTLYLYESLYAFKKAAVELGLNRSEKLRMSCTTMERINQ